MLRSIPLVSTTFFSLLAGVLILALRFWPTSSGSHVPAHFLCALSKPKPFYCFYSTAFFPPIYPPPTWLMHQGRKVHSRPEWASCNIYKRTKGPVAQYLLFGQWSLLWNVARLLMCVRSPWRSIWRTVHWSAPCRICCGTTTTTTTATSACTSSTQLSVSNELAFFLLQHSEQ